MSRFGSIFFNRTPFAGFSKAKSQTESSIYETSDVAEYGAVDFGAFNYGQLDNYIVGYEFPDGFTDDDLVIYNEAGEPVAILTEATDVLISRELNGLEELSFNLSPANDKYSEIKHNRHLTINGKEFVIDRTGDENEAALKGKVIATEGAIWELRKAKIYGLNLNMVSPELGLATILSGLAWTPGTVSVTGNRSLPAQDGRSALEVLREWSSQYNTYLEFEPPPSRKVNMLASVGADNGIIVSVDKNATGIAREVDSGNLITRLYVYGKDDLTIATVNPTGLPYIDDFSFFEDSEGLTTQEIYADIATNGKASRFLHEGELRASNFEDASALYSYALEVMAENCIPKVSYSAKVIDLSKLISGYAHETFSLGDTLTLIDTDLGINTKQIIVAEKRYPFEPERDEIELANKRPSLIDSNAKLSKTVQIIDRRFGSWELTNTRVEENFQTWMRSLAINEDGTFDINLLRGIWYAADAAIRAGLNESVIIDNNGITIAEHRYAQYNMSGDYGTFDYGEQGYGETITDPVLEWITERYIRITAGAVVMCAGEGLPIRTAITPDGILAPVIVIDNSNPLAPDGNAVIIDENGINAYYQNDENTGKYIRIGSGLIQSWNFDAVAKTGFKISAETGIIEAHGANLGEYISIGDTIDASDNPISTDGNTAKTGTRIVLDTTGIWAYYQNVLKLGFDLADGSLTLPGGYIEVGDTINTTNNPISSDGSTAQSGSRIIIMSTGIFGYYNNTEMLYINTTTGSARFAGEVEASKLQGGTISGEILILSGAAELKSSDFVAGSSGFIVRGDGTAELNEVTIRGTVYASAGTFSGAISGGSITSLTSCHIGTSVYLGESSGQIRYIYINSANGVYIQNSGSGANLSCVAGGTFTVSAGDFINLTGQNYFNAHIDSDYGGILFGWQGYIYINFNTVYSAQASISFGTDFGSAPFVTATACTESGGDWNSISVSRYNVGIYAVTSTGCTVAAREFTMTEQTGDLRVCVTATKCKPI